MTTFQVDDMTCGHCVGAITRAVKVLDADATVSIDLATHRVAIESTNVETAMLSAAITEAGYTPVALAHPADQPAATQAKRGGCCCART